MIKENENILKDRMHLRTNMQKGEPLQIRGR